MYTIRIAKPKDAITIKNIIDHYSYKNILLAKAKINLYESIQEFIVAEYGDTVIGCGALHIIWEDLGEIRSLAIDRDHRSQGVGSLILKALEVRAREYELLKLFCLTFEVDFFKKHDYQVIDELPITNETYIEMLQSDDEGVAEFLNLERVKPNTLGNSRMLKRIS